MKTFASKEKRLAPAGHKACTYVHHPIVPVEKAQREEIHHILRSTGAQAKLTVGRPDDKYEQEADRIADEVMRMPEPRVQRTGICSECQEDRDEFVQSKPLADQITPLVQRQVEEEEEEEPLQTKSKPGETPEANPSLQSRFNSLKGGGQPFSRSERGFFEPRFGVDFGNVRIHTDRKAARSATAINARAFTVGRDIIFGAGQFQTGNSSDRHLLAHELTHVVQQTGGWPRATGDGIPNDSKAPCARTTVDRYVSGEPTTIQRLPEDCPSNREIEPEHPGTCPEITRDPGERERFDALGPNVRMVLPFECYVLENLPINGTAFGAPALLTEIADFLLLNPGTTLHLTGFTDCLGSASTNDRLRNERAFAVEQYLTTDLGVDPAMIFIENEPETDYLATNDSAFDRAQNRAVAIYLDSGRPAPRPPSEPEALLAVPTTASREAISIVNTALSHVGSGAWAYTADRPPYPPNTNKCNLFVHEVLTEAGVPIPMQSRWSFSQFEYVDYPTLAGQWADPTFVIPGWNVVPNGEFGDVAAIAGEYADASGHVGIVSESGRLTISANATTVVENDWGFRAGQTPTFRRRGGP